MEDTTYLPERWGTLINFRSSADYGSIIFLSTKGVLHHREFSLDGPKWYSDWISTTSNADLNVKHVDAEWVAETNLGQITITDFAGNKLYLQVKPTGTLNNIAYNDIVLKAF